MAEREGLKNLRLDHNARNEIDLFCMRNKSTTRDEDFQPTHGAVRSEISKCIHLKTCRGHRPTPTHKKIQLTVQETQGLTIFPSSPERLSYWAGRENDDSTFVP